MKLKSSVRDLCVALIKIWSRVKRYNGDAAAAAAAEATYTEYIKGVSFKRLGDGF